MRDARGRLSPAVLSGKGAKTGDSMVFNGVEWVPGTSGASVTVSPTAPTSPSAGDLWYDTDATC